MSFCSPITGSWREVRSYSGPKRPGSLGFILPNIHRNCVLGPSGVATATERVRVVSSIDASYEFTTPRPIPVAFGATACALSPLVTSRRRELTPPLCAANDSHPFSCSYQLPAHPRSVAVRSLINQDARRHGAATDPRLVCS